MTGRIDRDVPPLKLHPNISVIVRVEDSPSGGHASEMEIIITIEDINDNPPECFPSTFRYRGSCCLSAPSLPQPSDMSRAHHLGSSDLQLDVQVDI